ncbi:N-6 DNA methylase [Rhizobium lentis]|uniref:Eco57I restriction-modification methylase domain-containing protein n=1 Tax=Rhizobium lentis TaxID=1138194 RepID=UPI001C838177|nr:N-6 DNA methylase [Rhizobium lentis]MBX5086720.1 N-6 DNA methylase [Rhizobium lentis]MBX5099365.1 N-6 DNA methylase [Rhizobium lentis]MBX5124282.1 N-6 DNA methylase [Rhizobium lentis]
MARHLKRAANIGLTAVSIEGGLISPDQVAAIAATAPDQKAAADYGCPKGTNLRDEITRYFRIGQANWQAYAKLPAPNEAQTAAFVKNLLEEAFGFEALRGPNVHQRDGHTYRIALEAKGGRVPIVVAAPMPEGDAFTKALQQLGDDHGGTIPRRSPSVLLQDWLNANSEFLWGLVFAGDRLRLMRDNASFTRPAYIEADLGAIFRDEMFADFTATWLLIHATRFGGESAAAADCALERWREAGLRAGTAARDRLGKSVKEALLALGQGFLDANPDLRAKLDENHTSMQGWFEQLLRVVYRLIFLAVAEDRELLHGPDASEAARDLYTSAYGFSHMRERSARRSSHDHHHDSWEAAKIVCRALERSEKLLGLPALGGLFTRGATPDLDDAKLPNRAFLRAIFHLSWLIEDGRRVRVNWRDMATEELGSVYEGLLELVPVREEHGRRFGFADADEAKGNARKTSGSYYTPDSLVQTLLDSTLDPVLMRAEAEGGAEAILKLSVIDPACGSGHFLLGAARRMAARVAQLRDSEAPDYPAAMRDVVRHSIYGVDRNPMAVELAKVALWIEALEPGKPLAFLDSHIRCGDSLVGVFDVASLAGGIPDAAYEVLEGDDVEVAKVYVRRNKEQREGKGATGLFAELKPPAGLIGAAEALTAMPEDTLADVAAKESAFARIHGGPNWLRLKTACDAYVAAFFIPKTGPIPGPADFTRPLTPETDHVWTAARGQSLYGPLIAEVERIAHSVSAFHWPLEFPAIMARGGFDVVIGNPPWERIKLQEQEFFAARDPEIATAANKAERGALIRALKQADPGTPRASLAAEFEFAKRASEAASVFVRKDGRFPLTGTGDVNTYALFAELFSQLARAGGRAGIIVPTGIATDSSTSAFFGDLVVNKKLFSLYDFQTGLGFFDDIGHARFKFCLLTVGQANTGPSAIKLSFFSRTEEEFGDERRHFTLTPDQILELNPNTGTSPIFRTEFDAVLTRKIYRAAPILIRERPDHPDGNDNPWGITFQRLFDMSTDSKLFRTASQLAAHSFQRDGADWVREDEPRYVPLYEAKMIHHFDHRFGSYAGFSERSGEGSLPPTPDAAKADPDYEVDPWYWVPQAEVELRVARAPSRLKQYFRKENADGCLKVLAQWVLGTLDPEDLLMGNLARSATRASARLRDVLGQRALERDIVGGKFATWLHKAADGAREMRREMPLTDDDLVFIKAGPADPLALTAAMISRKQPHWLMGWRDICRSTDERTVIASIFPKVGVGNKLPLMECAGAGAEEVACLVANLSAISFDYAARQKIGGTTMNYFIYKQLPVLAPHQFSRNDRAFIMPRVRELTYTSYSMRPWAENLGHMGSPFIFDAARRAELRAELDALFALKYGLSRDELRYVLDPADTHGADYPSETFRGLKRNEESALGEFRTCRLVLESYDRLSGSHVGGGSIELRSAQPRPLEVALPDSAWARITEPLPGDTGAVLAAILKAIDGPKPIRDVRLAAAFVMEPRLLAPLLSTAKTVEWRRLVGAEADPLAGNVATFVARNNTAWGAAVRNHRGNGRLIEDLERVTWAPGSGLEAIDTSGWPDGRSVFVFDALESINLDAAVSSLPAEIQQWVTNAAAA